MLVKSARYPTTRPTRRAARFLGRFTEQAGSPIDDETRRRRQPRKAIIRKVLIMNALYTAEALSTGHGREERASASDETFNVTLGNIDVIVPVSND